MHSACHFDVSIFTQILLVKFILMHVVIVCLILAHYSMLQSEMHTVVNRSEILYLPATIIMKVAGRIMVFDEI